MRVWVLGIMQWLDEYMYSTPYTPKEVLQNKNYLLAKPKIKFIQVELNTNSGLLIYSAMSQLTQNELKSLYSCKKALTAQELVLLLLNNEDGCCYIPT